jgi:gas vesicle protein
MKNNSKVLIALASAIVVGGVLGLLFAPNKGRETRKRIADAEKNLSKSIKETVNRGKDKLSDLKDGMKEKIEALNEKVRELV